MMNRKHIKCLCWKALWGLGFLSLILAWVTNYTQSSIIGYGALAWFWNALVLGVLAISIKLDCHSCEPCQIGMK